MKSVWILILVMVLGVTARVSGQFVYMSEESKNLYARAQRIAQEGTKLGLPHIDKFRDNLMRTKGVANYYSTTDGKAIMVRQLVKEELNRRERVAVDYVEAEDKAAAIKASQPKAPPPLVRGAAEAEVRARAMKANIPVLQADGTYAIPGAVAPEVLRKYYDQDGKPIAVDADGKPILPQAGAAPATVPQAFPANFFAPPPPSSGPSVSAPPRAAGPTPEQLAAAVAAREEQEKERKKLLKQARMKEATEDAKARRTETRDRLKAKMDEL